MRMPYYPAYDFAIGGTDPMRSKVGSLSEFVHSDPMRTSGHYGQYFRAVHRPDQSGRKRESKIPPKAGLFFFNALVAGPGVAPGPSDYAPTHLTIGVGLYHPRQRRDSAFSLYGFPD